MANVIETELRVLVRAPVGRDGVLVRDALIRNGLESQATLTMRQLCAEVERGVGAVFLTEEALEDPTDVETLLRTIGAQPSWSDLPIVVCYGKAKRQSKALFDVLDTLDRKGHLTLLERPTSPRIILSAIRSALHARRRQLERRRAEAEREDLLRQVRAAKLATEGANRELGLALARETEAREDAEAANRLKDVFLATLSHELRTPLNAILGFAGLLPQEEPGSEEFNTALATIVRNANLQRDLIDDILDVSRIISGKLILEKKPEDVVRLVSEALESFQPMVKAKRQTLHLITDLKNAEVLADSRRLQQVVWNLLSNAVKFTPEGGRIEASLSLEAGGIVIQVKDTGVGIDATFLPHVFDRFRQQDGSFTRKFGGLGLGLSIVAHIVEMHGGTIEATSRGQGQGATFRVWMPLAEADATDAPAEGKAAVAAPVSKNRILVVDDEPDSRRLVSTILRRDGVEVVEADSASAAREALAANTIDIIICDIGMPTEDGLTFMQRCRRLGSEVPAVALSGFVTERDKVNAIAAGFNLHLGKPALARDVREAVANLLLLKRQSPQVVKNA